MLRAAIRGIAVADYPAEVIEAWARLVTEDDVERVLANRDGAVRLVAEIEGKIVGLGAIVPGNCELRACYVAPGAARQGVGTAIVRALEQIACEHRLAFLELDSSLTAEPFYRSLGYVSQGRIAHRLASGQQMASIKMRKELSL
ncbi:MAG TPA: GNAT family N-acetyltransferase [Caulobacteraceae bacterium]|nr:GNAT family N-acetyltransferase [Caulobacteraceae bacterium]